MRSDGQTVSRDEADSGFSQFRELARKTKVMSLVAFNHRDPNQVITLNLTMCRVT